MVSNPSLGFCPYNIRAQIQNVNKSRIKIYIEEEYKYIKLGQRWLGYHIPLLSLPSPLNFNEQRFAHFKLSSDLCHQRVTSKQILKATMWVEVARPHTRSNSQIYSSVKSHSNSLLSISIKL